MAGRPSKYEERVKPYLEQITKWKQQGADNKSIAKQLGVAPSSFALYITKYSELSDAIKTADMKPLVEELRGALVKRALGFTYEEKEQYIKQEVDPETKKPLGRPFMQTKIVTKQALPDTTAIFGALNIYDEEYVKDKKNYELKQQELELRKLAAETKLF